MLGVFYYRHIDALVPENEVHFLCKTGNNLIQPIYVGKSFGRTETRSCKRESCSIQGVAQTVSPVSEYKTTVAEFKT